MVLIYRERHYTPFVFMRAIWNMVVLNGAVPSLETFRIFWGAFLGVTVFKEVLVALRGQKAEDLIITALCGSVLPCKEQPVPTWLLLVLLEIHVHENLYQNLEPNSGNIWTKSCCYCCCFLFYVFCLVFVFSLNFNLHWIFWESNCYINWDKMSLCFIWKITVACSPF